MLARTRARRLTKSPKRADQVIDWRELAECKGWAEKGVDPWFPEHPAETNAYATAKKICDSCPVAQKCLENQMTEEGGLHGRQRHGMFAGLSPDQRYALHRQRKKDQNQQKEEAA